MADKKISHYKTMTVKELFNNNANEFDNYEIWQFTDKTRRLLHISKTLFDKYKSIAFDNINAYISMAVTEPVPYKEQTYTEDFRGDYNHDAKDTELFKTMVKMLKKNGFKECSNKNNVYTIDYIK